MTTKVHVADDEADGWRRISASPPRVTGGHAPRFTCAQGLVICCALAACAPELPRVQASIREITRSNYDFIPEHWQEDYLEQLRREEDFDEIQADSQLELFAKLCDWTHDQWTHSKPKPLPRDNAVDILREIRSGKTGGWCGQFAYTFVDVMKAMGYFSVRYLELERTTKVTHYSTEIWSDEYRKWVAFDPNLNLYLRDKRTKVPASALEARDSLYGGAPVEVVPIDEGALRISDTVAYTEEAYLLWYHNVAVSMRSDLMRHRRPTKKIERRHTHLYFKDENSQPPGGKVRFFNQTTRREDIEYDCNTARVEERVGPGFVELSFFTDGSMYNFKEFRAAYGDSDEWRPVPQRLHLEAGDDVERLRVAPFNQLGRRGVVNEIEITW